jgi:hypothetical protein
MATKKAAKKAPAKKAAKPAKATKAKKAAPAKAAKADTVMADLDRRGLAAKARQLKLELMAIRFNVQSPSLKEYRKKRQELTAVLASLGN